MAATWERGAAWPTIAIGNYIDRLRFRYVIDFLDFHIQKTYTWPAFNIADSAIVIGVAVLLFMEITRVKKPTATNTKATDATDAKST